MALYYFDCENFGDLLNRWMWPTLIGPTYEAASFLLVGIGTILTVDVPKHAHRLVFGSGAGYKRPPALDSSWEIFCVRGPHTCAELGIPIELGVGDAATLLRTIKLPEIGETSRRGLFIPHHVSTSFWDWKQFCETCDLEFLDPASDPLLVIERIRAAPFVYTEAMHGAILADAFRVPWVPLRIYPHINSAKWQDWLAGAKIPYRPVDLRPLFKEAINFPFGRVGRLFPSSIQDSSRPICNRLSQSIVDRMNKAILEKSRPSLSSDQRINDVTSKLQEKLELLRNRIQELVV